MDNQPNNNRTTRIQGRWRHLIYISFVLLGAAALFLRFSGDGDGYYYEENFLFSSTEEEGHHRHLLRIMSSRRTTEANCNQYHSRPNECNKIPGCSHDKTACVSQNMMTMRFANMNADLCSQHNGRGQRCSKSGCTYHTSDGTCKKSHECEAYNGQAGVCNSYDQCVFNSDTQQCEMMMQMSGQQMTRTTVGQYASGDTSCHSWHPSIYDHKTW